MNFYQLFVWDTLPVLFTQGNELPFQVFNPQSVNPVRLLEIVFIVILAIVFFLYGSFRYRKFKEFKVFEHEMKSLDLNPEQEDAFASLVKQYAMHEPVNVIYSPRLFDEMATKEIIRVLGSAGSASAKERFINIIYDIRVRTYHPDWLMKPGKKQEMEQPVPVAPAAEPNSA